MKHNFYFTLIWGIFLCNIASAQHYYYAPTLLCNPGLQQKNSIHANLSWVRLPGTQGINLNLAHAITPHFFVAGSTMFSGPSAVKQLTAEGVNYRTYDLGGGYYKSNGQGTNSLLFSASYNNIFNTYSIDDAYSDLNFVRFSIQPNLNIKKRNVRMGLSLRLNYLRYLDGGDVVSKLPANAEENLRNLEERGSFIFPDFGIMLGFPIGKNITLGYQLVYTIGVPSVYNFGNGAGYINVTYNWSPK